MAIQLVGSNLNIYGNNGQFETDRSTWGFGDSPVPSTRSSVQKTKGLYSALLTFMSGFAAWPNNIFRTIPARFTGEAGKKYIARVKVYTPTANKVGNSAVDIFLSSLISPTTIVAPTTTNPDAIENTWTQITWQFSTVGNFVLSLVLSAGGVGGAGVINIGGLLYVDEFEIFEYIDVVDPEEPPPPSSSDAFNNIYHSKNHITIGRTASDGWNLLPNFRMYNEVLVEDVADTAEYNSKLKTDLPPDVDGNVVFYLMEAFRDAFTFVPPANNASSIIRLTDRIKRFKTVYGEMSGTETIPSSLSYDDVHLVLYGGISKEKWPGLDFFTTYLQDNKKFLTWAPVEKSVDRLQEDYLNFWLYDEFAEIKLQAKAYFDDGTNETAIIKSITGTHYGELYQIPAGPANCGVNAIAPEKNVVKYELTLLDNDDAVISETRIYHIASLRHPLTRFFMALNSLGSFEVFRFYGRAIKKSEFVRDVTQRFLSHDYTALDGEFATNGIQIQNKHSYNSGYFKDRLATEWHQYMIDFFRSPVIYDVTSGTRRPVIITNGSHEVIDQDYRRSIEFEAKPAYDDECYTPDDI
jgi:hypothetical protein